MTDRAFAWWRLAEQTASSLSRPRVDLARADAEVYDVASRSWLFARGAGLFAAIRRAWLHSRVRALIETVRDAASDTPAGRIRFCCRCVLVAAITVLALLAAGTSSGRGFQAIVPIAAGIAAVAAGRSADGLARAWFDRRA